MSALSPTVSSLAVSPVIAMFLARTALFKPFTRRTFMASTIPLQQQQTHAPVSGKTEIGGERRLLLWSEHDKARNLAKRCIETTDLNEKQKLFNQFVKDMSLHSVAEEVVIYPAFRNLTKDEKIYNCAVEEQTAFERILYDLDQQYGTKVDASLNSRLEAALRPLNEHIQHEEKDLLPVLESRLSAEDLDNLNTWYERIKTMAPTRPHPEGPKSAIGHLTTAPLVTFIDKFRDMAKKF